MIVGKDSIWKMLALFALVLVAVLDLISTGVVSKAALSDTPLESKWMLSLIWINFLAVGGALTYSVIFLYKKWSSSEKND